MSFFVQRQLRGRDVVPAVGVGHEGLGPLAGPLHRSAQLGRGPGDDRFLGVVVDLGAEAAAHVRRHHAKLAFRDLEHESPHQQPDDVRVLAGGEERVLVRARVVVADGDARFDGVGHQPVIGRLEPHHPMRASEGRLGGGGVADMPVEAHVARHRVVHGDGAWAERRLQRRRGRKRLVFHLDEL